jgi:ribosome-binding factor A
VREVFKVSKVGTIVGCYVTGGKITRNAKARVIRDAAVVFDGELESLRRFKDDVREVAENFECGIQFAKFQDLKEGDVIEAYATRAGRRGAGESAREATAIARIDHEIQRILGTLISQELQDPRLAFVTVTRVEVSDDLRHCKVFVSVIGDRHQARQSLDALHAREPVLARGAGAQDRLAAHARADLRRRPLGRARDRAGKDAARRGATLHAPEESE